jgi:hypothetical protein
MRGARPLPKHKPQAQGREAERGERKARVEFAEYEIIGFVLRAAEQERIGLAIG